MQQTKRIALVGGGPGGLTLARLLWTRGIAVTVFELDPHELSRPQGGSLDLHRDTGILALERAGLMGEFARIARHEDQGMRLYDERGALLFDDADSAAAPGFADHDRPEVDRTALRSLLLASLPADAVRWGVRVRGVTPVGDGTHQVVTEGGVFGPFDLVVGADGAWSRVRPLLSEQRPVYTGVTFLELQHDDVDERHPELAALVGRGKMFALGDAITICAQRSANAHVRTYVAFRRPEGWAAEVFDCGDAAGTRARLVALLRDRGFAPALLASITSANDAITVRAIHALPVGHRWQHRPGLTLIGDAAHVMSPFSGEGVNIAMFDAAELADKICTYSPDLERAVREYEASLFERAAEVAAGAAEGIDTFVGPDARHAVLAWMASIGAAAGHGVGA